MKTGNIITPRKLLLVTAVGLTMMTGLRLLWYQWSTPPLGYEPQTIGGVDALTFGIVIFACAIYIANALYGFIFYLIGFRTRRDHRMLYFSFMILLVVFATLMTEGFMSAWLQPESDWRAKAIHLGLIAGGVLTMLVIRQKLRGLLSDRWPARYLALSVVLAIATVLVPNPDTWGLLYINSVHTLIPCLLALVLLYKMTSAMDRSRLWLFLGALAAVNSFVWLVVIEILDLAFVSYPLDLMMSIICISIFFFRRYELALAKSERMTAELLEANRSKDTFLVSVAHEIKNPLHGILNIAQAVTERERDAMSGQSIRDLHLLQDVGRSVSMLLNELLELEKFKGNRIAVSLQAVSAHRAAEAVLAMLRFMTDRKNIRLVNRIPADFPPVNADENRLNQILLNLVHNAVKFSGEGEVSVGASAKEGWATLSVKDDGPGIDEAHLSDIFDPYKQCPADDSYPREGIGLGLSICKQLVELHGGKLEVHSTPGEGSVFSFTLRLYAASPEVQDAAQPIEVGRSGNLPSDDHREEAGNTAGTSYPLPDERTRILAVDDDPVNVSVLESIFSGEAYELTAVTSGEEALASLDAGEWDLVIADVMMPRMSGYELTKRIREKYSIFELPVLLLTAHSGEDGVEAGFRAGANDYVAKPMNAVELVSRAKSLISLKESVNERMRMEAAWLQAQIKPHFIINTFNSIAALGRIDLDRMDDMIEELSTYIRLSIDYQNADGLAPIERELELVRSYLYIQEKRFSDRMAVIWEVDERVQMMQINIPPLTIQPLVENAISHGILKRISGGVIRIVIRKEEGAVIVTIRDNGVGMNREVVEALLKPGSRRQAGIGLLNTDRRLKQVFGEGLAIESVLGEGTTVSFRIPE